MPLFVRAMESELEVDVTVLLVGTLYVEIHSWHLVHEGLLVHMLMVGVVDVVAWDLLLVVAVYVHRLLLISIHAMHRLIVVLEDVWMWMLMLPSCGVTRLTIVVACDGIEAQYLCLLRRRDMLVWCMMIIEVDQIEVAIIGNWRLSGLRSSLERRELMVILLLECKKWIDCCFNFLNWRRYFLFNFLEWLLRLYHWRFIHSPNSE